jgi:hypothetical protein
VSTLFIALALKHTYKSAVEDPHMTLMKFLDPSERDVILGPLYATEAKDEIPVFGPDNFKSKNARLLLNSKVKLALQSDTNPVANLLVSTQPEIISQSAGPPSKDLEKLHLRKDDEEEIVLTTAKKIPSSRELHDESHYTSRGVSASSESKKDMLDHVMLQRAMDGYLFNCKLNRTIVNDDEWLQNVWEWIEGESHVPCIDICADVIKRC